MTAKAVSCWKSPMTEGIVMEDHIEADLRAYDDKYREALEEGFVGMVALI